MKQSPFAYNNNNNDGHNFSLMASAFLVKDFTQMNVFVWICTNHKPVCLDMHRFCSFDNWLCDPISTNWQLTLHTYTVHYSDTNT